VCYGRAASKIQEQTQRSDAPRTFANNTVEKYPGKDVLRIFIFHYSSEEESCRRFPSCSFVETYPSRAFCKVSLLDDVEILLHLVPLAVLLNKSCSIPYTRDNEIEI